MCMMSVEHDSLSAVSSSSTNISETITVREGNHVHSTHHMSINDEQFSPHAGRRITLKYGITLVCGPHLHLHPICLSLPSNQCPVPQLNTLSFATRKPKNPEIFRNYGLVRYLFFNIKK